MELTNEEIRMVLAERRRREAEERRFKARQEKEYPCLVYERGSLRAYKDCDGKHTPWSVYDGDTLVCMCVYKKGAIAVVDYIDNLKTKEGENDSHQRGEF